jgi:hypothetical protein
MLRPRDSGDGLFELAKSDAALLHSSLMLSANHLISVGCTRALVESTLYQHKTTVIRMINERLGDLAAATCDGTVGAVANLTILEVSSSFLCVLDMVEID